MSHQLPPMYMSLGEFYDALENADWYYEYADDQWAYNQGKQTWNFMRGKLTDKQQALYKAYCDYMFGVPGAKRPERPA